MEATLFIGLGKEDVDVLEGPEVGICVAVAKFWVLRWRAARNEGFASLCFAPASMSTSMSTSIVKGRGGVGGYEDEVDGEMVICHRTMGRQKAVCGG